MDRLVNRGMVSGRRTLTISVLPESIPTAVVVEFIRDCIPALTPGTAGKGVGGERQHRRTAIHNGLRPAHQPPTNALYFILGI